MPTLDMPHVSRYTAGYGSILHGRPDARRLKMIESERESAPDGEVVQWARDSVATLVQEVGVDHGGTDVRVSQQCLSRSMSWTRSRRHSVMRKPEPYRSLTTS